MRKRICSSLALGSVVIKKCFFTKLIIFDVLFGMIQLKKRNKNENIYLTSTFFSKINSEFMINILQNQEKHHQYFGFAQMITWNLIHFL